MSYSGIEHKLRIFISSKCGGKYSVARKALKKLLDATGLVDVYAFETEPASSEDTQSSYLEYIDESSLCIFLVDNKDGAPPAVLSEEKRAKDKHLRLLYLFCDESEKKETPMQEEIRSSLSQKYRVVHEFSDLVSAAYDSVMQDIIAVYRRKETYYDEDNQPTAALDNKALNTEMYALSKSRFIKSPYICRELTKSIFPTDPRKKEVEGTRLEKLLSEQIRVAISLKQFDEAIIDEICSEVLKENTGKICDVLELRYQAQKKYFGAMYSDSLLLLQKAIALSIEANSIPTWYINDIAIDIRYIQQRIDEQNNVISLDNPGQKYIDASNEPIYFPYIDREDETLQELIAKKYYEQMSTAPYTINLGGIEQIFSPVVNAFCVAQMHASILQSEMTIDRLIDVYSMLCTLYEDHGFIVEYVRLLIANRDTKRLDNVIRTYNQAIDILNRQDMEDALKSINNRFDPLHQMMSKYILASRLGYYMSDITYSELYKELIEYSIKWARDDKRVYNLGTYIFDFYKMNTYRSKGRDIVVFICEVIKCGLSRYYRDCFQILRNLNLKDIDRESQLMIKEFLFGYVTTKKDNQYFDSYFASVLIGFCKNTEIEYDDLENAIREVFPNFYNDEYLLEMSSDQDSIEFIDSYLNEARSRNKTQGANGGYTGYAYESLDVVYNILKKEGITLDTELIKAVVDIGLETLVAERQTVRAKLSAVKLIQMLYFKSQGEPQLWDEVKNQMLTNAEVLSVGHETWLLHKDNNDLLSFQYNLFVNCAFEQRRELLLEKLYSIDYSDSYTILQFLRIIINFLNDSKGRLKDDALLPAFLYYSILMSQHRERDVKYYAAICLIKFTAYSNTRNLALKHLSQLMNSGAETVKIAILTRLEQLEMSEEDLYLKQIINKGKADNNYLVRYAAEHRNV